MDTSKAEKGLAIKGYASVFRYVDQAQDIIKTGAFKNSIENQQENLKLLWQHDAHNPIGRISNIREDDYGLLIKATITAATQAGREAIELIKSRIVTGLSVGIVPKKSFVNEKGHNEIFEAALYEISVVTFPANLHAKINSIEEDSSSNNIVDLIASAKALKHSLTA